MMLRLGEISLRLNGTLLLDNVSLAIDPGEVVTLVGPNGAGKSTLMRVASGLMEPTSGFVEMVGQEVRRLSLQKRASLCAVLHQSDDIRASFTLEELVLLGLGVSGCGLTQSTRSEIVMQALHRVGLSDKLRRDVTTLSGGERQRAQFARVLAQMEVGRRADRPGILMLDEPLSAQDMPNQLLIMRLAQDHARRGGAVLSILHDLNWAASFSDRIVVINGGRLMMDGSPGSVMTTEMMARHFNMSDVLVGVHEATGRPYIVPHDFCAVRKTEVEETSHVHSNKPLPG